MAERASGAVGSCAFDETGQPGGSSRSRPLRATPESYIGMFSAGRIGGAAGDGSGGATTDGSTEGRRRLSLRIAMLGTRGIPASYSGFETCVEELGSRLVQRGHEVTVYCRSHHIKYAEPTYKGMHLIKLPTIRNKYLDTIVHTFLSMIHAAFRRFDVAMTFIAGNSLACWIPRLAGRRVVLFYCRLGARHLSAVCRRLSEHISRDKLRFSEDDRVPCLPK